MDSPWIAVRAISRTRILTSASYSFLVVIPIIAGLWPLLDPIIDAHNSRLDSLVDQFSSTVDLNQALTGELASDFSDRFQELTTQLQILKIEKFQMPLVWLFGYLAALFSVIGHIIFEIRCENDIKHFSKEEYINKQIQDEVSKGAINVRDLESQGKGVTRKFVKDVEKAASSKYEELLLVNRKSAVLGLVVYAAALIAILSVVVLQAKSVFLAVIV